MVVILFATLVALAFSQNAYGLSSLNITATTNKESYDIMEEIFITGKLLQNSSIPVSDGLVTIQVDIPKTTFSPYEPEQQERTLPVRGLWKSSK